MKTYSEATESKIKSLGTVNTVVGILSIFASVFMLLVGLLALFLSNQQTAGEDELVLKVYAVAFLFLVPFSLVFGIVDIVAGKKLRMISKDAKGWVIYSIVIGALSFTSLTGILQLIFGIIALTSMGESEKKIMPN